MIGFAPYAHSEPAFPPQTADASCAGEGMTAMPTTAAGADCAGEAEAAALSGADMAVLAVSAAPRDRAVPGKPPHVPTPLNPRFWTQKQRTPTLTMI